MLYYQALQLPKGPLVSPGMNICQSCNILLVRGLPSTMDLEVVLDRDYLGSEALNALEELPAGSL